MHYLIAGEQAAAKHLNLGTGFSSFASSTPGHYRSNSSAEGQPPRQNSITGLQQQQRPPVSAAGYPGPPRGYSISEQPEGVPPVSTGTRGSFSITAGGNLSSRAYPGTTGTGGGAGPELKRQSLSTATGGAAARQSQVRDNSAQPQLAESALTLARLLVCSQLRAKCQISS